MLRLMGKHLQHVVADPRTHPVDALELLGACLVDRHPAEFDVRHLDERVRIFNDVRQQPALRERDFDALLEGVGKVRQFPIQSLRFLECALQLGRLIGEAPPGFVETGGERTGLPGRKRRRGRHTPRSDHVALRLQEPDDRNELIEQHRCARARRSADQGDDSALF